MNEIWRNISGFGEYDKFYQVSNLGNVKSLNYNHTSKEKIIKPRISNVGYNRVMLSNNGIRKMYLIHRLVAEAFIPNPNNYPCVNHIDENKQNNCV